MDVARKAERYARQLLVPEVAASGLERLASSSVLVVGAGGLGTPMLSYLVGAGVGRVGVLDDDVVSLSNLPRQTLYETKDVGVSKAVLMAQRLEARNPHCTIEAYPVRLTSENAYNIIEGYDLLIDACDNLATRHLMDLASEELGIPYLFGAIESFRGQCSLFGGTAQRRYRDLFPSFDEEADAQPVGVIGPAVGMLGCLMATEAMKILLGYQSRLDGQLLLIDAWTMEQTWLSL